MSDRTARLASIFVTEDGSLVLRVERKMTMGETREMCRTVLEQVENQILEAKITAIVSNALESADPERSKIVVPNAGTLATIARQAKGR